MQGEKSYIQKLFTPKSDSGTLHTLEDLLQFCVPESLQGNPCIF